MSDSQAKRVGLKDIAAVVEMDVSTVSLALNGSPRIAEATREKILRVAEDLDYRPDSLARGLRGGRTRSVGLVAASLDIPFFVDLLKAQERWLVSHDYTVLFANLHGRPDRTRRVLGDMQSFRVDGVCVGFPTEGQSSCYRDLVSSNTFMAFYTERRYLHTLEATGANAAVCDLECGCFRLLSHLFGLGHRRIAYIGHVDDREHDYVKGMRDLGLSIEPEWILNPVRTPGGLAGACARLLALVPRPSAVFVQSDAMAAQVMNHVVRAGVSVPTELSIVGVNNNPIGELVRVPLTTLGLPTARMGAWMSEAVVHQCENPDAPAQTLHFETELIERESSVPPSP